MIVSLLNFKLRSYGGLKCLKTVFVIQTSVLY